MKLPLPLPVLAGAVGAGGYLVGHLFAGNGAGQAGDSGGIPATPAGTTGDGSTDPFAGWGGASLSFGDGSSGPGTLNGITPGGSVVGGGDGLGGTDTGGDLSGGGPLSCGPMPGASGPWVCNTSTGAWERPAGYVPPTGGGSTGGGTSSARAALIKALGPIPAGAAGYIQPSGLRYVYTVSGGKATRQGPFSGLTFSAYVGASAHYLPNATLRKILSGSRKGQYVHVSDVTTKAIPA